MKEKLIWTIQVYQCTDKRCITAEQVCDLLNDCGHWEDEENCVNHFKCASNPVKYIRFEQVCNFPSTSTFILNIRTRQYQLLIKPDLIILSIIYSSTHTSQISKPIILRASWWKTHRFFWALNRFLGLF